MSDIQDPSRRPSFADHPVIRAALAAVEAQGSLRRVRASAHVASRIFFPGHMEALSDRTFFPTCTPRREARYRQVLEFLESVLQKDFCV